MPDVIGSLLGGITGGGGTIGAAIVRLRLDSADYQKEMATAQARTQAGANQMGQSVSKFGAIANAAFLGIGVAAVGGIALAIKAGSDLNEQINKSNVVFGKAAEQVIKFSETTASSLGIAQAEALTAAGNFGTMFDAAGFASQAAADMSVEMVQLSADLGSFNNIPVAEALEKIRAGLAGEAEPLRQLGVFLSEARVETEAYTSGIAKQGEELTDAQKIQARYQIILRDTTKAQGDFARTVGESLPNQLKVMKAELIDTAAALGTELLPIALDVVKVLKSLVPIVGKLAENLGLILGVLLGWAALKFLPPLLFSIGLALEAMGAKSIASGIGNAAGALQGLAGTATGLGYVAVAVGAVALAMKIANDEAPTFAATLGHAAAEAAKEADALQPLNDNLIAMRQKANLAEIGITNFSGGMENARTHINAAGRAVKNFADMTQVELKEWRTSTKESFESYVINLDKVQEETDFTRKDLRDSFRAMLEHARDLNQAMRTLSREHWINDDFVKFLAEQPDKLILFANSNETQQRRMQHQWELSGEILDTKVNKRLDAMTGALDKLDKGETKHKITIEYDYVGFDPTKPGMAAGQTGGAQSGQQR